MTIFSEYVDDIEVENGRHRLTTTLHPRFFHDGQQFREITNHPETFTDTHGVNEKLVVRLRKTLKAKAVVVRHKSTYVSLTAVNANQVLGIKTERGIIYPGAWVGVDLEFILANQLVIKRAHLSIGHPQTIAFDIDAKSNDFNIISLAGNDLLIRQPYLEKDGEESIPLAWDINGNTISVTLPAGDWSGWTLDPTFTSQPDGTAGLDNEMLNGTPTLNYGTLDYIGVGNYLGGLGGIGRSLIRFDLSTIPANAIFSSVVFTLSLRSNGSDYASIDQSFSLYRVKRNWGETTSTWNVYTTGSNWGGAGCADDTDRELTSIATSPVWSTTDTAGTTKATTINVSNKAALDLGYGWALIAPNESSKGCYILCSSEFATPTKRPKLEIVYTILLGGKQTELRGVLRGVLRGGI